ncbi:glycoside hydrolase family 16 protein [Auriscalpium vulgare]|uniref:Glycoside hydrolase family 16 protein n=1 Tax=Auriscalpium vulgare TaxID=40419 RepID=A0ACB8S685_9AGAM|nr:glycoside hydrolase family 16 protein [Auriscalpium vulgare]
MASYPSRRNRYSHAPQRSSIDDDDISSPSSHLTRALSAPRSPSPLSPPRPAFLAGARDRGSYTSDASTLDSAPTSDSERDPPPPAPTAKHAPTASRKRRSTANAGYAPVDNPDSPSTPSQLLQSATDLPQSPAPDDGSPRVRAPPSAYPFPFQAYPGNPDPGMAIPGMGLKSRRASIESFVANGGVAAGVPRRAASPAGFYGPGGRNSMDGSWDGDLERPYAPFMAVPAGAQQPQVYRSGQPAPGSTPSFRAPFLAPSSRPSSVWAPPSHAAPSRADLPSSPHLATYAEPLKPKPPLPSTLLMSKLDKEDKPWLLQRRDRRTRGSWWLTFLTVVVGIGLAGLICWRGYTDAGKEMIADNKLCFVMGDDFDSLSVDSDGATWVRDAEMSGFGNGEFEMTTTSSDNLFVRNGQLYIMPTLTTNYLKSPGLIFDGGNYTIPGCTAAKTNASACSVASNAKTGATVPPIMSARISTKGTYSIQYGKVEVVAKLPRGDWLWPAIWMLPTDSKYGAWPLSGEIDIMEGRGNGPEYPAQGNNYVRSTLTWGALPGLIARAYGWQSQKRTSYAKAFHTYTMEWTQDFIKIYVDSRLTSMVDMKINNKQAGNGGFFFNKGKFPTTSTNGTATEIVVPNPWKDGGQSAPFDQSFYLVMNLAAGGTSGWFPDKKGDKPWFDSSNTAMRDFAQAQSTWSATWPDSDDDRAFRMYVPRSCSARSR